MRHRARLILLALLFALPFTWARVSRPAETPSERMEAGERDLADSVDDFGFQLYRDLARQPGNFVFSPLSLSTALEAMYSGAGGATRSEIRQVLRLRGTDDVVYQEYGDLLARLDTRARASGAEWSLISRAWVPEGLRLLPQFKDTAHDKFGCEIAKADFPGSPELTRLGINLWVLMQTKNRIPNLLPQGSITTSTRLAVANAVYFKEHWQDEFDRKATHDAPFHTSATETKQTPMMYESGSFREARIAGARVLELPYREDRFSMLVVLPDAVDGLAAVEQRLSEDDLSKWVSALASKPVHVGLPRFKASWGTNLSPVLAKMGMPLAFDPSKADFSGITGEPELWISTVEHKAFVVVDEEGTVAAATSATNAEEFLVDRPFLFLIRDELTGCVLFMGRVVDPTA